MRVLFIFLDGVGLGATDPHINPLACAHLPTLNALLEGRQLAASSVPFSGQHASLVALDSCLGVAGLPQSATGQAALLTGRNVPAWIGEHYGPKPNARIADALRADNLFSTLRQRGYSASMLNAYPPRYFEAIDSGHRQYSAFPLAATAAGIKLKNLEDLHRGNALSADFTAQGWIESLGFPDAPSLSPHDAGKQMAKLALESDLTFFEYWASDVAGHRQDMEAAVTQLEVFDAVLGSCWNFYQNDIILVTSDHGNLEDLSTRRHTRAAVPALVIGPAEGRAQFCIGLHDLTDVAPAILRTICGSA